MTDLPENVRIIRKRIKHTYLHVYPGGEVVVTVPFGTPDVTVAQLLRAREGWIRKNVAKARERSASLSLRDGERVYLFGEPLTLVFEDAMGPPAARRDRSMLVLSLPGGSDAPYTDRRAVLLRFYGRALTARVGERLAFLEAAVGKRASRIRVRLMRSRWGSCTPATGAIRLNLTLSWYPPECLDLVLAHELTHLWVAGHGAPFYQILDRAYPGRCKAEKVRREFPTCPFQDMKEGTAN